MIQRLLAIWSLVSLPFRNPACTSGSSQSTYSWSLAWRTLSITFNSSPLCVLCHISCVHLFATPWIIAHQTPLSWNFPGKNTGVGYHFLLQGIFLTQGSNLHFLHQQVDSLPKHHLTPFIMWFIFFCCQVAANLFCFVLNTFWDINSLLDKWVANIFFCLCVVYIIIFSYVLCCTNVLKYDYV